MYLIINNMLWSVHYCPLSPVSSDDCPIISQKTTLFFHFVLPEISMKGVLCLGQLISLSQKNLCAC